MVVRVVIVLRVVAAAAGFDALKMQRVVAVRLKRLLYRYSVLLTQLWSARAVLVVQVLPTVQTVALLQLLVTLFRLQLLVVAVARVKKERLRRTAQMVVRVVVAVIPAQQQQQQAAREHQMKVTEQGQAIILILMRAAARVVAVLVVLLQTVQVLSHQMAESEYKQVLVVQMFITPAAAAVRVGLPGIVLAAARVVAVLVQTRAFSVQTEQQIRVVAAVRQAVIAARAGLVARADQEL